MSEMRDLLWVRGLDQDFLECRAMRHSWQMNKFDYVPEDEVTITVDSGSQVIRRQLECTRCWATKVDYYVRTSRADLNGFQRHSSRYIYRKGYTFKRSEHELANPRPNDYIFESFRRAQQ